MLWTLLVVSGLTSCTGLRILSVLPFPMKSHHIIFNVLFEGLVSRGHDVVVYSGHPLNINASNYKHNYIKTSFDDLFSNFNYETVKHFMDTDKLVSIIAPLPFHHLYTVTEECLSLPQIKELIASNKEFDVVILETFFTQEALIGFGHRFNAPVVTLCSLGSYSLIDSIMGNHNPVAYIPNFNFPSNCDLTFGQKLKNVIKTLSELLFTYFMHLPRQEVVLRKHFVESPPLQDMLHNVSVVLMNSQPELNYARPFLPNMVDVGGIHIPPVRKPLPKKIQTFMDEADIGVVYFSLGSTFSGSTLPEFFNKAFVKAFSTIPERVLWKIDSPPGGLPDNVMTVQWAPQTDVLAHLNCKAFITHGGFLSLLEATHFTVPVIGIPLFADQPMNIAKVKHAQIGVGLNMFNLSSESVLWALNEILHNPKYKRNMEQLSAQMRDRLVVSPLDTAVHWVEYVAKHQGAPQLRSPARNMSFFQYLLIDVVLLFLILLLIIITSVYYALKVLYCVLLSDRFCAMKSVKDKKE